MGQIQCQYWKMCVNANLGLGTVQFGTDYGITNKTGKVPETDVEQILALAADSGIRVLDTAAGYGDSEDVLGKVLGRGLHPFDIVTKAALPVALKCAELTRQAYRESLYRSLERLGQDQVYGFLAHRTQDLLQEGGDGIVDNMQQLKAEGVVRKIGISVYTAQEIDAVLDLFKPDLVQLPINVLDQRLVVSGHLRKLKDLGVEIHARSIFLQGVLLQTAGTVPSFLTKYSAEIEKFRSTASELGVTCIQAALGFVLGLDEVDVVVVGVNSVIHLQEVLNASQKKVDPEWFAACAADEEALLNPSLWGRQE